MIEACIREPDGDDFDIEEPANLLVRLDLRSKPVACPQPRATAIQQAIARALEANFLIEIQ